MPQALRRPSPRSVAARWSSSPTTRTARTRATSSWRRTRSRRSRSRSSSSTPLESSASRLTGRPARRARTAADGQRQPGGAAHGVHGDGRPRSRDHDGHLGLRPRANAPRARRPSRRRRRLRPPGPHPPAAQPARAACSSAPGTRRRRSTSRGLPGASRLACSPRSSPPTGVRWRGGPSSRRSPSRMGCRW